MVKSPCISDSICTNAFKCDSTSTEAMPIVCAAVTCKNRGCCGAKRKVQNPSMKISWHRFPLRNPDLLGKWLENLPRRHESWVPRKHDYLCSQHFKESCYEPLAYRKHCRLKPDAVPTEFITWDKSSLPRRRSVKRKVQDNALNVLAIVAESELANICRSDMLTDVAEVLEIESEDVSNNESDNENDFSLEISKTVEDVKVIYYYSDDFISETDLIKTIVNSEKCEGDVIPDPPMSNCDVPESDYSSAVLLDHVYCLTFNSMKQRLDSSAKEVSALKQKLKLCEARLKRKEESVQSLKERLIGMQTMIQSAAFDLSSSEI